MPRPPRQGKGSRARRAHRPARGGVARPALPQAAERRARIDRCRRRSRGDAAQPGGSCARAPRLSGTRGSARAYWKRAPERREAQCTEPGTPRPSAGPGTRAPAAVAPEGPPWARARPGGGPGTSSPRGSQGLLAGQEAEGAGARPKRGTRRRSRGAGCQQLQNEASSLPGILVATPSRVAQRQAGTGAPRPANGAGGPGPGRVLSPDTGRAPSRPAACHPARPGWGGRACRHERLWGHRPRGCPCVQRAGRRRLPPFPKNVPQHVDLFKNHRHFITGFIYRVPTKVEIFKGRD